MAHVVEISNPFEPLKDTRRHVIDGGQTVREFLVSIRPGFVEFDRPTICLANGNPLLRKDWGEYKIKQNDVINFVAMPGANVLVYAFYALIVVSVAYSVYVLATMPKPKTPGDLPEADPTYDLKGQTNQLKLGVPIEVPYGRCRLWPTYAARPYNAYIDNEQWQYSLFCLGQGSFEIHEVRIEDTEISNFEDVTYEIYAPGEQVTLFPDNVVTSVEVNSIELFGPNEPEYSGPNGPYTANPAQTLCNRLEIDVTLPLGLYYSNDDGGLDNRTVTALFEYRKIDDDGNPLGDWATLANFSKTLKTNTPKRFTVGLNVPQGRYEVRGVRTNNKDTNARAVNVLNWAALRAFLPSTKDYGDVTLLALKARASNNLNDRSAARLNVYATRKLPTWNGSAWTAPTATRSLVWAFCDVFRAEYGGRLADSYFDLTALSALNTYFNTNEIYFDFIFDQRTTLWEAAKTICQVGRAIPMLNGSQPTIIREQPKTLPTAIFNPDNIVEGSFIWEIKLSGVNDYDGVEIEYTDPDSWKIETIKCLVGDDEGYEPEPIRLSGCTSRTVAYREGMYRRSVSKLVRENVKFATGLEGHIPTYGDLIGVCHDLPRWSQGGLVLEKNGLTLTLSEPVTFGPSGTHVIALRTKSGAVSGPHTVIAGPDDYHVLLVGEIDTSEFYFEDPTHEPALFLFGLSTDWTKLCKVVGIQPGDDDTVEISAVAYVPEVFAFDADTPPPLGSNQVPDGVPDLPNVTGLNVVALVGTLNTAQANWDLSLGARYYVVQKSYDGTNWDAVAATAANFVQFEIVPGVVYVRVSGVNVGQGPWINWDGYIGVSFLAVGVVSNLRVEPPYSGGDLSVAWDAATEAVLYSIRIYNPDGDVVRTFIASGLSFVYTLAQMVADGTNETSVQVGVTALNSANIPGTETLFWAINIAVNNDGDTIINNDGDTFRT